MISGVIYGFFALMVIVGFLYGLKRGLIKSAIRIIAVLVSCVVVVFLTEPITNAILNLDISSAGLELGGVSVSTVNDTIINFLSQISVVAELISASPTIKAVISAVPKVLVNIIMFIVVFYLIKAITYFICIIINKIALRKQPEDAKKYRLWGGAVGALQGIIIFLFVLMPIAGTMNVLTEAVNNIDSSNLENTMVVSVDKEDGSSGATFGVNTLDEYNDVFIIKMFNAVGYKALTDSVYDKLTVIKIDEQTETTLRYELNTVTKIYNGVIKLDGFTASAMTAEDEQTINQIIDDAFSSPIIGGAVTELTVDIAKKWTATDPTEFLTVAKPTLSADLVEIFDELLIQLRSDTKADLQKDLKILVSTVKVCADYEVIDTMNKGTTDEIVVAVGKEGFIENLIGTMSEGKVTKNILPSVVELGLDYAYSGLEVDNSGKQVTKSASEVNWSTEKVVLGDLFENISRVYVSSKNEGEILEKLDLKSFGKALNLLKQSELLGNASQDITVKLLTSSMMNGVDTSSLVSNVKNDTTYKDLDFEVMLMALESSANIAGDIKDITTGGSTENLKSEDVGTIIEAITGGGTTADMIGDMASQENLTKSGVDEATAGAVSGLVGAIKDYDTSADGAIETPKTDEELDAATKATEELLLASKNAKDTTKGYVFSQNEEKAKEKMQSFVDNLISSPFIYSATITKGEELGFKTGTTTKLSVDEVVWLKEVLNAYEGLNKINEQQKVEIANMFAVSI